MKWAAWTVALASDVFRGFVDPREHLKVVGTDDASGNIFRVKPFTFAGAESREHLLEAYSELAKAGFDQRLETHMLRQRGSTACDTTLDAVNFMPHVTRLEAHGITVTKRYVNIGANDGIHDDPLFEYVNATNATGVAIEVNPELCAQHRANLPHVDLVCTSATPANVASLLMHPNGRKVTPFPGLLADVIKIDLDSYDAAVVKAILDSGMRSIGFLVEVNPSIPPPYRFAMDYHPDLHRTIFSKDHTRWPMRGMSLGYAVSLLGHYGYDLVSFGIHDAFFIDRRFGFVYEGRPPFSEIDCFKQSFVSVNGIPISHTRRWFFDSNYDDGLREMYAFFKNFTYLHNLEIDTFPFKLDLAPIT